MSNKEILLILGNQLFPIEYIKKTKVNKIFMAEDFGLTTNHKHHKLKILMFLWSMRQYRDNLIKNGYTVFYHSIDEESFHDKYEDKLLKIIKDHDIEKLKYFEIEDNDFEDKILNFINNDILVIHNAAFDMGFINNELINCDKVRKRLRIRS